MNETNPSALQVIDYLPMLNLGLRLECDPTNFIDGFILANGVWEPLVISALSGLIKHGHICVDVGANSGYISLAMARYVGDTGRVISFEPNKNVVCKFNRNLELNPEISSRIELLTLGLGSRRDRMFVAPDRTVGIGNAGLSKIQSESTTDAVDVTTLDSFNLTRLDCLKIDVEGMELEVLRGAEATIKASLPNIIFETLMTLPPETHKPLEDWLRHLGYRIYCLNPKVGVFDEIGYPRYPQDDTYAIHPGRALQDGRS